MGREAHATTTRTIAECQVMTNRDLEVRVIALEKNQASVQELTTLLPDIKQLIELLEDVKSALRIFVKVGNGFKWVAGIVLAFASVLVAIRKWLL